MRPSQYLGQQLEDRDYQDSSRSLCCMGCRGSRNRGLIRPDAVRLTRFVCRHVMNLANNTKCYGFVLWHEETARRRLSLNISDDEPNHLPSARPIKYQNLIPNSASTKEPLSASIQIKYNPPTLKSTRFFEKSAILIDPTVPVLVKADSQVSASPP
jgi:hypothetical protein